LERQQHDARGSRLGSSKFGQDGAIRLPFGSTLRSLDTLERCLPA
jgi:hypothetical protein